jgi:hypothetical protein
MPSFCLAKHGKFQPIFIIAWINAAFLSAVEVSSVTVAWQSFDVYLFMVP